MFSCGPGRCDCSIFRHTQTSLGTKSSKPAAEQASTCSSHSQALLLLPFSLLFVPKLVRLKLGHVCLSVCSYTLALAVEAYLKFDFLYPARPPSPPSAPHPEEGRVNVDPVLDRRKRLFAASPDNTRNLLL